jgi:hypothetical protein
VAPWRGLTEWTRTQRMSERGRFHSDDSWERTLLGVEDALRSNLETRKAGSEVLRDSRGAERKERVCIFALDLVSSSRNV